MAVTATATRPRRMRLRAISMARSDSALPSVSRAPTLRPPRRHGWPAQSQEANNGMSATTYDLSFEQALGELQSALGRPVNVMIRPRDPAEQPQVVAHMSGRLMRAEVKYSAGRRATRAEQGES